jgi:hypothetical protein
MHAAPRPRKKVSGPLLRAGGELHVVGSQDVVTVDDPHGAIHRLVELADGSRSTSELVSALMPEYPQVGRHDVLEAISELEAAGVFEDCTPRRRTFYERNTTRFSAPL